MRRKKLDYFKILCVATVLMASLPIARNHIMSGGRVTEWIARVRDLAFGFQNGIFYFFPDMEILNETGIWINGVNSNLWFFLPGFLVAVTDNIVFAYRIYMLLIQMGTAIGSILFFQEIFANEKSRLPVFFGTLLYMTCPYRIFVCYDLADLSQAVAWMLLPFYVWAVLKTLDENRKWKHAIWMGVILAGVGYANVIFFITFFGMTLLVSILIKNFRGIPGLLIGAILGFPGLYRLGIYLSGKGLNEFDIILRSIMPEGYYPGQFFSNYCWRDNHPGMGFGMFISLMAVLWVKFVKKVPGESYVVGRDGECVTGEEKTDKKTEGFIKMGFFFIVISLSFFPWDLVQRLGIWALRLVSLIDTPAVFWGMACFCLCIPGAGGMNKMKKAENKTLAVAIPFIVLIVCVWMCINQCDILTSTRPPIL